MNKRALITVSAVLLLVVSCGRDRPSDPDSENSIRLYAVDTSGVTGEERVPIEGAVIRIISSTFVFQTEYVTGPDGYALIEDLPAGSYAISAEKIDQGENLVILGQKKLSLIHDPGMVDTVFMNYQQSSPITINEVYYCGCNYSRFYMYDQYVELYNSSTDTLYLDGHFLCRNTQISEIIDPETVDYALAYYVFAFPGVSGVTRNVPIAPGEFIVVATDAVDHQAYGGDWCVDLTGADWEFFNPLGSDYDAPGVPNLLPVSNEDNDFSMNLAHAAIYLSSGLDWEYGYHYDENLDAMKEYVHIPLHTIIDGVEYSTNPDATRYMTIRIDAGLAGNGIGKYSARSTQRKFPGLDSNNSSFDFETVFPPTPGYQ